jgi:hypothetical protein
LRLIGIPALLWLLLATTCTPFVQAAGRFWDGPLQEQEQTAFLASNHRLIFEDVGALPGTTLAVHDEGPRHDEDERVVGMDTTFRLSRPLRTPTVDAWRSFHPKGMAPSNTLDAAYDTDIYRPAWRNLDEIARRLERIGFHRDGDYQTGATMQSRRVTLRRDGVTVWLFIDIVEIRSGHAVSAGRLLDVGQGPHPPRQGGDLLVPLGQTRVLLAEEPLEHLIPASFPASCALRRRADRPLYGGGRALLRGPLSIASASLLERGSDRASR